ncbi:MAG: hypothetical protein RMK91_07700 [Pseudanabaenaceae cyanobacterium SKYGB_i_bin29]|nr:hypothetical protein [Pseudanabaenaceae cyanobacterium SKYG29]MDW8421736.1 hypothetical protein [Pseudanabaenaceae cyanobacterium SKYGB_i_bin29]
MNPLDRQVKRLLEEAPLHGIPVPAMKIIANVLRTVADRLEYPTYTILTASNGGWLQVTLSNRQFPELEKKVVYAYPSYGMAKAEANKLVQMEPVCQDFGTIDLLFQLLGLAEVDSLIFLNHAQSGKEINRRELYNLCQKHLQSNIHLA